MTRGWRRTALAAALAALTAACGPAPSSTTESDLAVLARSADGFAQAEPGVRLEFPRDHGAHPDFRIEWWYLTANLEDRQGRPYGVQWTLFRHAVEPPGRVAAATAWQSGQVYMAHLGITSPDRHFAFQRYARGGDHDGVAQAGVRAEPFAAWLDDWQLASTGSGWLPLEVRARQGDFAVELQLEATGPLVLQGESGFSRKHPEGGGSYYYSQPFLAASGTLWLDGERIPVAGQAWLDREWSSQFLQPDQSGWDWFALHLDSGEKLMLFRLRQRSGSSDWRYGVLLDAEGGQRVLEPARMGFEVLRSETVAGRPLPLSWRIELPEIGRSLQVDALHSEQWMAVDFPYWEGVVRVHGDGPGNSGRGYLELTGYASR